MNLQAALAIDEAHRRGVTLTVVPPCTVRFKAQPGAMTQDLLAELKAHKVEVIRILSQCPGSGGVPNTLKSATATPQTNEPPPKSRHRERMSDPETVRLIAWLKESRADLPHAPFRLAPWLVVSDPEKFFDRLLFEADAYPYGDRPVGLGTDLALLKAVVDGRIRPQ